MNSKLTIPLEKTNFLSLSQNPYPGRGIVAGLDETSQYMVQIYWIMGRSENSRNRVFWADNEMGRLFTEAADPSTMKDPSLLIYNAMRERRDMRCAHHYVVSNGDQTDTVIDSDDLFDLCHALAGRRYEPDAPNFTQRITAVQSLWKERLFLKMAILRKSILGGTCDKVMFNPQCLYPGFGHCITTYSGDGDPLPPFRGDPLIMPLNGGMEDIAHAYWDALDEANRVSLAVKWINTENSRSEIHIINKY